MPDCPVKLYSLSTCGHCNSTKKLLRECDVEFTYVDVDVTTGDERAQLIEEIKKINARGSFPTIVIGEKVIVGYNEKEIREALNI
ncbi:Glutaredoxin [Candidatus Desulfarcum epimagneticum]|uniref:Glutaredoxin n=1 Tax=uncultured Desulfobacteraceae bacterium TaxID=218296 RepID=A0A484HFU1_9BACT|nr:Glutaredoxin [uncultured Desulfobacteraceae bacterium]